MADEASTTDGGTTDGAQNAAQDAQAPAQEANTPPTPQAPTEPSNGPEKVTPTPADLRKAQEERQPEDESPWKDPQKAQVEIERLRRENAKHRISRDSERQQADERLRAVLKAAGIETDEASDEDPMKAATTAREKAEAEAHRARMELAVYRAAPETGADPTALLNWLPFRDATQNLDPSDQDAITGAIRDAIKDAPRLASTQAAARSSADFTGGTGDSAPSKYKPGMSIADGLAADGAH